MAEQEAEDVLIPVRRWIRGHYTKLTSSNETKCNHCNEKFTIHKNQSLAFLHKHLVEKHLDKLKEEQTKEVKFHWTWDYFIASDTQATCKQCDLTIKYRSTTNLKNHLKCHKILGPNSDCVDNDSNSDNDMTANEDISRKTNDLIPVSIRIRGHYTKLTSNKIRCNHCNEKFSFHKYKSSAVLHEHLVKTHSDKLKEEQKRKDIFHWIWDYFIAKSNTKTTCKECGLTITYYSITNLKDHLNCNHKILGSNSDYVDNESNSDNDMTANEDITLKTDKFIPVRRWIREHYTRLTNNKARCNHCNANFIIYIGSLVTLHKHLLKTHSDILTEGEKKEDKFHWTWDYFITESDTEATCKLCDLTINNSVTNLNRHLKHNHKMLDPNSDCIDNDSNSDNDMTANEDITQKIDNFLPVRRWIRGHYTKLTSNNETKCNHCNVKITIHKNQSLAFLHTHLVKRHSDKLIEEQTKEDKFHWIWDYFIAESDTQATCKQCDFTIKYSSTTNLKKHLNRHKIFGPNSDCTDNNSNLDIDMTANEDITQKTENFIPVRRWIREHYTKLTSSNKTKCNHCSKKFTIHKNQFLDFLHKHLVKTHPDILIEEEKKEDKFHWTWDYFIAESNTQAKCKQCALTIKYYSITNLKSHLKRHKILGPNSDCTDNDSNSDNDMTANEDITQKIDNFIPVRSWICEHYTKLTSNKARCKHCNAKFIIHNRLDTFHKHLVKTHPYILTEKEKKEDKFHWTWDYFIAESDTQAICKQCDLTIKYRSTANLKKHLKRHKILGSNSDYVDNESNSDNDMPANEDMTLKTDNFIPVPN